MVGMSVGTTVGGMGVAGSCRISVAVGAGVRIGGRVGIGVGMLAGVTRT